MTEQEINEIIRVNKSYKKVKDQLIKDKDEINKTVAEGSLPPYIGEIRINELYNQLNVTKEREEFHKLAMRTREDDDFEKHFREIHLKIFWP